MGWLDFVGKPKFYPKFWGHAGIFSVAFGGRHKILI